MNNTAEEPDQNDPLQESVKLAQESAAKISQNSNEIIELKSRFEGEIAEIKKAREDLAGQFQILQTQLTNSQNELNSINEAKKLVENSKLDVTSIRAEIGVIADEVKSRADTVRTKADNIGEIESRAAQLETRLTENEKILKDLTEQNTKLEAKIKSLLPAATSTGLAASFAEQRKEIAGSRRFWAGVFLFSIVLLLIVAVSDPFNLGHPTLDNLPSYLLGKSPLLIPIVWLALYAASRHTIAGRLQEEYRHKETLSTSFEGYKREIEESGVDGKSDVSKLYEMMIATLALNPSRVFTEKHPDHSPFEKLKGFMSGGK